MPQKNDAKNTCNETYQAMCSAENDEYQGKRTQLIEDCISNRDFTEEFFAHSEDREKFIRQECELEYPSRE